MLERPAAEDRRRHQRTPVYIGAGLREAKRPTSSVTVVDLSAQGCGIEIESHVTVGARVWLKLPGLESWDARVAWCDDGRAGLEFTRPLHPAVVSRFG
jgi:hypothetical protein